MPGKSFEQPKESHRASVRGGQNYTPAYYVFNAKENDGFVIVSADDRTDEILAFSDSGSFNVDNMPSNVKAWLSYYEQSILSLGSNQTVKAPDRPNRTGIAPLIKTTWGQHAPYNNVCAQYGPQIVTGCVATAMAQVINYNKWPITTTALIPAYTTYTRQINIPEQPITSFDWDNIDDSEIAKLMMYCGASVKMDYAYDLSGASAYSIAPALKQYFGYDQNTRYVLRTNYDIDEWEEMIYSELSAGRAVIYDGMALDTGHEFICDGYKDGLFHINWGWNGSYNAYYSLSILNPNGSGTGGSSSNDGYSINQGAIIGIQKPSGISPEGTNTLTLRSLSLNENGKIEVILINVNAESLNGKIGIALYQNETFIKTLQSIDVEASTGDMFGFIFDEESLSGLSDSRYKLFIVYRANDTTEWTRCNGSLKHYMELTVSDGTPSLILHPVVNLTANRITFSKGKRPSVLQDIIANITNNSSDEYNSSLALFINGQVVSATGAFIRAGETEDIVFRYAPIMGNLNLQIKTETGEIVYEEIVPVFNEDDEDDPFFNLNDNQMIFGHYNTHDYNASGTGLPVGKFIINDDGTQRMGLGYGAVKFLANKMATIKGRKITHVRFALRTSIGVNQVKIMIGTDLDNWNILIQNVPAVKDGWNTVKLDTPIIVDGTELCIGLQLYQEAPHYPGAMSYVSGSSPGSCFTKSEGDLAWENLEQVAPGGSLSLQCLVEGTVPFYDVELIRLHDNSTYSTAPNSIDNLSKFVKTGTEIFDEISFCARSIGKYPASHFTIGWQIDDGTIQYDTTERELVSGENIGKCSYTLPANLSVGSHVIKIFITSINDTAKTPTDDTAIKVEYKIWSNDIGRQKSLLDFQASLDDPNTTTLLSEVSEITTTHEDVVMLTTFYDSSTSTDDVFQMFQPKGLSVSVLNRDARPGESVFRHCSPGNLANEISIAATMPSFATINIDACINSENQLEITVSGIRNEDFEKLFRNTLLTVLLTEDKVQTSTQLFTGELINGQYDGVLRKIASATWGDSILWADNFYEKKYVLNPSSEWDLQNTKVVAFLSEKAFNYTNACDIYVINCNDFALSTIDLSNVETEETRLKFTVIGDDEVAVKMRDQNISGDIIIPSEISINNKKYRVTQIGIDGFWKSHVRNVVLPNSIETINNGAFRQSTLESINIPTSVKTIDFTFTQECDKLKTITVESDNPYFAVEDGALIKLIDEQWGKTLFAYPIANGVTEYVVPNDIETIYGSFNNCTTLNKITLPEGLKNLMGSCFSYCEKLKEINIPSSLIQDGGWSFAFTSIEEYNAPSSLEFMGSGNFVECRKLRKVSLNNSHITQLFNDLFFNCVSLEEVSLPSTVTYIDVTIFRSCDALRSFYVYNPIPPELNSMTIIEDRPSNEFEDVVYANATLYIPRGSLEAYCNAPGWNKFVKIEEFELPKYALTYVVDGEVYKTDSVCVGSTIETESAPTKEGYTFSGWSDIPQTMPANDVEITGKFSINSYTLTYILDGEEYKSVSVEFGKAIEPEPEPTKEGYTFSGWSDIPQTMPANEVKVIGSFSVNKYLLTVIVNDEVVFSDSIAFGTRLAYYADLLIKQGIDLTQWEWYSEIDKISMPAHDVKINAVYNAVRSVLKETDEVVIFDIVGRRIETKDISTLPSGIYIIGGRKFIIP